MLPFCSSLVFFEPLHTLASLFSFSGVLRARLQNFFLQIRPFSSKHAALFRFAFGWLVGWWVGGLFFSDRICQKGQEASKPLPSASPARRASAGRHRVLQLRSPAPRTLPATAAQGVLSCADVSRPAGSPWRGPAGSS